MAVWDDTRVKPHVRAAAKEIAETFGIQNIGGFASSGHIPDSDHYKGLALDVMTTVKGQAVANWAQQNAGRLSITYVIWNRHIWDSRNNRGWEPYHGTSPHTDHVHISFFATPGEGGATLASNTQEMPGCIKGFLMMFGIEGNVGNVSGQGSGADSNPSIPA